MKKLAKILTLAAAVIIVATGCKKLPTFTPANSSSGGGDTPTTGGTFTYHLNSGPEIGPDFISISAEYSSDSEITEMRLAVSMKVDMPEGYTNYGEILINSYDISGTVTGLEPSTNYFWCILYIENGNSYKTEPVGFTTLENGGGEAPTVTTSAATEITTNSAVLNGIITNYDSSLTYGCLFEWGLSETLGNVIVSESINNGSFSVNLTGLTENTTYYYRAYATIDGSGNEGSSGDLVSFTTSNSNGDVPTGAINGLFSVSDTKQIYFSKGNLQYKASTNTWRFAENQWDYVGDESHGNVYENGVKCNNIYISSSYSGWIDLLGWGTSGYNHGAYCYQPYSTSTEFSDYYAYGNADYNLNNQTGKADWGYNAISNGGNMENQWRTLTEDEWMYVFNTRNTTSGIRYGKAQVNGVNGMLILPDDWSNSYYNVNNTNNPSATYSTNIIDSYTWQNNLEAYGAIFLPAAGFREGSHLGYMGEEGDYWTATKYFTEDNAYRVYFYIDLFGSSNYHRYCGHSVRLVQDAE
jgi:hypothetical protein